VWGLVNKTHFKGFIAFAHAIVIVHHSFSAETDIIRSNVDVLVKTGLGSRAEEDFLLARDTCVALLKLNKSKVNST
jgi:hypothetical protein